MLSAVTARLKFRLVEYNYRHVIVTINGFTKVSQCLKKIILLHSIRDNDAVQLHCINYTVSDTRLVILNFYLRQYHFLILKNYKEKNEEQSKKFVIKINYNYTPLILCFLHLTFISSFLL